MERRRQRYRDANPHPGKRQRRAATEMLSPLEAKLHQIKKDIVFVGNEGPDTLRRSIEDLSSYLSENLSRHEAFITRILGECVSEIPVKSPIYATVIALLNTSSVHSSFVGNFIAREMSEFSAAIRKEKWRNAKLILRFIACLVSARVVSVRSFIGLLQRLLSLEYGKEYFTNIVLNCLPFVGEHLRKRDPDGLQNIFSDAEEYIRSRGEECRAALFKFPTTPQLEIRDTLSDQFHYTKSLQREWWRTRTVLTPQDHFHNLDSGSEHSVELDEMLATELHTLTFPSHNVHFKLFEMEKEHPQLRSYDIGILREYISDVLYFFNPTPKVVWKFLVSLPCNCSLEALLVETIFSEAMRLPSPEFPPIYYSVVLAELSKQPNNPIAAKVMEAMELILENIEHIDLAAVDNLLEVIPHQISQFEFSFDWTLLEEMLPTLNESVKGRYFVSSFLNNCLRLSWPEKFAEIIPEALRGQITTLDGDDFVLQYDLNDPNFMRLCDMIRKKSSIDELQKCVSEISLETSKREAAMLCATVLLYMGRQTYTFIWVLTERYGAALRDIGEDFSPALFKFWQKKPHKLQFVLSKWLTSKVVSSADVVRHAVMTEDVGSPIGAAAIHSVIQRLETQVKVLRLACDKTEKRMSEYPEGTEEKQSLQKELDFKRSVLLSSESEIANTVISVLENYKGRYLTISEEDDSDVGSIVLNRIVEFGRCYFHSVANCWDRIDGIIPNPDAQSEGEESMRVVALRKLRDAIESFKVVAVGKSEKNRGLWFACENPQSCRAEDQAY